MLFFLKLFVNLTHVKIMFDVSTSLIQLKPDIIFVSALHVFMVKIATMNTS